MSLLAYLTLHHKKLVLGSGCERSNDCADFLLMESCTAIAES
jgi:hypothetical protein